MTLPAPVALALNRADAVALAKAAELGIRLARQFPELVPRVERMEKALTLLKGALRDGG